MIPELKKLNYFLVFAEELNFSKAALKLNISQPTLSQYISRLEKDVGYELIDRNYNPLRLTPAGEIYANSLRAVMEKMENAFSRMNDVEGVASPLLIGTSPSICHFVLPDIIQKIKEFFPDSPIHIYEGTTAELNKMLSDGKIDLSLSVSDSENSDFIEETLYTEGVLLAVSKNTEYYEKIEEKSENGNVSFKNIASVGEFITLQNDQVLTRNLLSLCEQYNINPKISVSVTELSSAVSMMRKGLGTVLIPGNLKKYVDNENTAFYRINELKNDRVIAIHYKKGKHLKKIGKYFIDLMKKT